MHDSRSGGDEEAAIDPTPGAAHDLQATRSGEPGASLDNSHVVAARSRWPRVATIVLALLTLASLVKWWRGFPGLNEIPGWFYRTNDVTPVGPVLAVVTAAFAPTAVRYARRAARRNQHVRALVVLVFLGAAVQSTTHFLVPAGLEQAFERLTVGHGEFLRVATQRKNSLLETLRDYDDLYEQRALGVFAGSKPPGTLGTYIVLDKLSRLRPVTELLTPLVEHASRSPHVRDVPRSAALALVLFPLLTFVAIVPLVWLGRMLFDDDESGYDAALLAYSTPALLLIDLHLDGSLFPLLGVTSVALAVHAARKQRWWAALVGGCVGMLGTYCSYALLTCLLIGAGAAVLPAIQAYRLHRNGRALLKASLTALTYLAGALITLLVLVYALEFEPVRRFDSALAFHVAWKAAVPTDLWRWLSLVEFGLYVGAPLCLALVALTMAALPALSRDANATTSSLLALGISATLAVLAWKQGTNEVARLWLFMVPFIGLSVAGGIQQWFAGPARKRLIHRMVVAQLLLTLVMKVRQGW